MKQFSLGRSKSCARKGAFAFAVALVPFAFCMQVLAQENSAITADRVYSDDNIRRLKPLAENGNVAAAKTLEGYYAFYHFPHTKDDDDQARKWLAVAAKDGDPQSMLNLANVLWEQDKTQNCSEVKSLVESAVRINHELRRYADDELKTFGTTCPLSLPKISP